MMLGPDFEVKLDKQRSPKMKMFGINNELNKKETENDLNQRNVYSFENICQVRYVYRPIQHRERFLSLEVSSMNMWYKLVLYGLSVLCSV